MTYTEAYHRLQEIVEKLENDTISVDELTKYLKEAKELVTICQIKLREIKKEVDMESEG